MIVSDRDGNEWTIDDVRSHEWQSTYESEAYWRSWAAVRSFGFMVFGAGLGALVASLLWWAFS